MHEAQQIHQLKDKKSQKRKEAKNLNGQIEEAINYVMNKIKQNLNDVNIDNIFAYNIVLNMINNEDHKPKSVKECR